MTPTNELRFVERSIYVNAASGDLKYSQNIRILQQKFVGTMQHPTNGRDMLIWEWRDVPLVEEKL
jgi:hypothetical protein